LVSVSGGWSLGMEMLMLCCCKAYCCGAALRPTPAPLLFLTHHRTTQLQTIPSPFLMPFPHPQHLPLLRETAMRALPD
jgi:hypothetical protein